MSTVKIEAQIDVTNQKQVEALNTFLRSLGGDQEESSTKEETAKPTSTTKKAKAKDVVVKDAEVVSPEAETTTAEPAKEEAGTIKIEDVRALLSKKVANHRDAVKDQLTKLGANNVTSLDKAKYQEFVDFLNGLA